MTTTKRAWWELLPNNKETWLDPNPHTQNQTKPNQTQLPKKKLLFWVQILHWLEDEEEEEEEKEGVCVWVGGGGGGGLGGGTKYVAQDLVGE